MHSALNEPRNRARRVMTGPFFGLLALLAGCATAAPSIDGITDPGTDGGGGSDGNNSTSTPTPTPAAVAGGTCSIDGTLSWSEVKGATYTVEYGPQGKMLTSADVAVGVTTYKIPTKLGPGTWTWHVRAHLGGVDSAWSDMKSFVVAPGTAGSFKQTMQSDFAANTNTGVRAASAGVVLGGAADGGTGADGVYAPGSSTTLPSGTYNYKSFTIASGVTITVTGTSALVVKVQGAVSIAGTLDVSGPKGGNGVTSSTFGKGGIAVAGGNNGGDGVFVGSATPGNDGFGGGKGLKGTNWQGGSGAGYANAGGNSAATSFGTGAIGGVSYGTADLSMFLGGSGGGGGSGGNNCGSGGGGAGGGALEISGAGSFDVSGSILANGGPGGSDGSGNCGGGGGGSGGAIWLVGATINNTGSISATGGSAGSSTITKGGPGSDGRIRLDGTVTGSGTVTPAAGYTGTLAYKSPGTTVTAPIQPMGLCSWGVLTFDVDTSGAGTSVVVDVLDATGNPLAMAVTSSTDLSTLPAVASAAAIELRATLATTTPANSPILKDWSIAFTSK